MNRLILPVCLLYVASLCGSAAGAEICCPAHNSTASSMIVETAPAAQSSQPIRTMCRKAGRTALAVVVVPVIVTAWWIHDVPKCAAKVRSAFTWDRGRTCE